MIFQAFDMVVLQIRWPLFNEPTKTNHGSINFAVIFQDPNLLTQLIHVFGTHLRPNFLKRSVSAICPGLDDRLKSYRENDRNL